MDQETLARRANLSRPYISRLERGLVPNPGLAHLEQIAQALGMTMVDLVTPETHLVELHFSHEWSEIQRQTENLPPAVREIVLRAFKQSIDIANGASDLARRN